MEQSAAVEHVLQAWRANPFQVDDESRALADAATRAWPMDEVAAGLLRAGDVTRAKKLTLALGHKAACQPDVDANDVQAAMPERVFARLPRPRSSYLRVVLAAGRCHAALHALEGGSAPMARLRRQVWAACFGHSLRRALEMERVIRDHDVLLLGETGTGKELVARALLAGTPGDASGQPAPSASLNAAAVPETLIESELFGHVKGAFTGATDARIGRIRTAHGGCLFLDEVGDLPSTTQVKLLRVIETNEVHPLGSDATHRADVRYIAATHKDLEAMVEAGGFRQDLFERLAGNVIRLPPLRERPDDIPAIGEAFVASYVGEGLTRDDDVDQLRRWLRAPETRAYGWPGNVRELQNAIRNLMLGLDAGLRGGAAGVAPSAAEADGLPDPIRRGAASLQTVRDWYVGRVLESAQGNMTVAARILGVDRTTVRRYARSRIEPAVSARSPAPDPS